MKKRWIIAGGIALTLGAAATVAVAERGEKRMREHGPLRARIVERLDLTDEQQEQLQEMRAKHQKARREQRQSMVAMGREQREAVMGILTEEQQETLKEMRGRFLDRHGGMGRDRWDMRRGGKGKDRWDMRGGGKGRGDAWRGGGKGPFSRLDLTDEQKQRLGELRTEHRTEMRETRASHRKALEGVLTGEQRDMLETMKDQAFYGGGRRWRGKR